MSLRVAPSEQSNGHRRWIAHWTQTRQVVGYVYATSKTDAERRIRNGEGRAMRYPTVSDSAPRGVTEESSS